MKTKEIISLLSVVIFFAGCATRNNELNNKKLFKDNSKFLNDTSLILAKIHNNTSLNIKSIKEYDAKNNLIFKTTPDKNSNQILCNNGYKLVINFSNRKLYKTRCKNPIILK